MPHIRKISLQDARAIQEAKAAETGSELSAYAVGAMFAAVQIGATETDLYFHVNRDGHGLPGTNLGSYDDLTGDDYDAVLEATYEAEEDVDGETVTVTRRVKIADLPEDAVPIETDLAPHRFA